MTVWFAAGNRDADHYPDPHRLDLERNPVDHLTFGRGGPHVCLGAHLARMELRVYLEEFVAPRRVRQRRGRSAAPSIELLQRAQAPRSRSIA